MILRDYLVFIGSGLYLVSGTIFLYLFIKTLGKKNGNGLIFLKLLTLSLSFGSFILFLVRILSEHGDLPFLTARAISVINPILLNVVALYFNYLIHQKPRKTDIPLIKDIKIIKENVIEVKGDVKVVKEVVKQVKEKIK